MARSNVGVKAQGSNLPSPAAGAYFPITIALGDFTTDTAAYAFNLDAYCPTGMELRILGITSGASALTAGSAVFDLGNGTTADAIASALPLAAAATFAACDGTSASSLGDFLWSASNTAPADELRLTFTTTGLSATQVFVTIWVCPVSNASGFVARAEVAS